MPIKEVLEDFFAGFRIRIRPSRKTESGSDIQENTGSDPQNSFEKVFDTGSFQKPDPDPTKTPGSETLLLGHTVIR